MRVYLSLCTFVNKKSEQERLNTPFTIVIHTLCLIKLCDCWRVLNWVGNCDIFSSWYLLPPKSFVRLLSVFVFFVTTCYASLRRNYVVFYWNVYLSFPIYMQSTQANCSNCRAVDSHIIKWRIFVHDRATQIRRCNCWNIVVRFLHGIIRCSSMTQPRKDRQPSSLIQF